jgi:hypothetical protein
MTTPKPRRVAIIVRGSPGSGKSTIVGHLLRHYVGSVFANLDNGWVMGEWRANGGDGRYADLRDPSDILLVELAYGEPTHEGLGATRNPREWIDILEGNERELFFFILKTRSRDSLREFGRRRRGDDPLAETVYDAYDRGCCTTEAFSKLSGFRETLIDAEHDGDAGTSASRVIERVGPIT